MSSKPMSSTGSKAITAATPNHVLFLIDQLLSTGGGAEGVIRKLCQFLPADRFRCSVATLSANPHIRAEFPCPVHIFPLQRIYGWNALHQGLRLRRILQTRNVRIVHTFFPASDLWGGVVARLSHCPVLVSSRRDMGILRLRKHRFPYFFVNHLFDQVQAVSEKVREFCIQEDHIAPEKVVTVPNGVDLATIDKVQAAYPALTLGVDPHTPIVITVANLRFVKGIDVLLRAMAITAKSSPDAIFTIVGGANEEAYERDLIRLAAELGIGARIRFLGPRTDVFSLLKMADIFCLPSRTEGLSNALLEAMGCGLPCVATDVGGNPEVLANGESGFLVPSDNPELLAMRLSTLLRDRNLRKRMGDQGRAIVEGKFTVQHMVTRLARLYDDLLRRRGFVSGPPDRIDSCIALERPKCVSADSRVMHAVR